VAVVTAGKEPAYIAVTPDDQYALVLNRTSGDMAVIRIATLSGRRTRFAPLFTMIPVGSEPVGAVVRPL
jgi:DNA-binding beta-propeller fold protein YncE